MSQRSTTDTPQSTHDDKVNSTRRRIIVTSTTAVWVSPIIKSVVLPVHAQTSNPIEPDVPFIVRIAASDAVSGVSGDVTGAEPKDTVTVSLRIEPVDFTIVGDAGNKGRFAFALTAAEIEAKGATLSEGSTVTATAKTASGKIDSIGDSSVITAPAKLKTTISSADATTGIAGMVTGAVPSETVTVELLVDGVAATVAGKADTTGQFAFSESAESLAAKGVALKSGSSVKATSESVSGRVDTTGATAIATGPTELDITLGKADAVSGVQLSIRNLAVGESVSVALVQDGHTLTKAVKAEATAIAKFTATAAELKSAGISSKEGAALLITAAAETSGLKGELATTFSAASSRG